MREKFARFMMGRNGMDDLANFEVKLSWVPLILMLIFNKVTIVATIFNVLFWVLIVHTYFRIFSKNLSKRYEENQKFLNWRYNQVVKMNKLKKRSAQRKDYRFYKCPMCKQEVRVPKGHGKIEITCPKCREKFVRRS